MVNTRQISGRRHPLCLPFLVQSLASAQDFVDIPIVLDSHLHLVKLMVDALPQMPIVDTGCPLTILVWREWYEKQYHPRIGVDLATFYYDPMPNVPVHPELNWTVHFATTSLTLFEHHGIMEVEGVNLGDVEFNLICDKTDLREPSEPHALFGLGMRMGESTPLLEHLYSNGKIDDLSFSLYLNPSRKVSSGILRLGGYDPQKYIGTMEYFRVAPGHEWAIYLDYVGVNHHRLPAFGDKAVIDTGTDHMMIPAKHWQTFRKYLENDLVITRHLSSNCCFTCYSVGDSRLHKDRFSVHRRFVCLY